MNKEENNESGPITKLFAGILAIGIPFLLLAGWIALLLAPPFGTAVAIGVIIWWIVINK